MPTKRLRLSKVISHVGAQEEGALNRARRIDELEFPFILNSHLNRIFKDNKS